MRRRALFALYVERGEAIRRRLDEFAAVPSSEYFYELLYCLLTPQSSAVNAGHAVSSLRGKDFFGNGFDPEPCLSDRKHYIRFHRTKAKRLLEARLRFAEVSSRLEEATSPRELRAWLVANIDGLGWKEASHFLRNIGHRGLAILDRHILRNLVAAGALQAHPKTLTEKSYLDIEKKFIAFAEQSAIPIDELDLLFWSMETGEILK